MLDGFLGVEHAFPALPAFRDIAEFSARSGTYRTATVGVQLNTFSSFARRIRLDTVTAEQRNFWPPGEFEIKLNSELFSDYNADPELARMQAALPAAIVAAGGKIGMGSHGDFAGLGFHWEMWLHTAAGMRNRDVLRAATIWGAEAIGYAKDLGSIEPGKLADLVVLDANPLDDIHNTVKLHWVVKGGRLFEAFTLQPVRPPISRVTPD
jgi:predicted amidohydrolase YtcJ